jgi:hypothetical protein
VFSEKKRTRNALCPRNNLQDLLLCEQARCTSVCTECSLWREREEGITRMPILICLSCILTNSPLCMLFLTSVDAFPSCRTLHCWPTSLYPPLALAYCGWNIPSHPLTQHDHVTSSDQQYMGGNDRSQNVALYPQSHSNQVITELVQ